MKPSFAFKKIKEKLKISNFMSLINPKFFENFWEKKGKKVDVSGSPIFVNTLSRGYFSKKRRLIFKKFVEKNNLKVFYITQIDQILISKVAKNSKIIFIASGDGFFDYVVSNKFFNNKKIGFFPMGVGNAVFSFFNRNKPLISLCKKKKFYEKEIDVIRLYLDNRVNETLLASVGLDAEFMRLHPPRSKHGILDYLKGSIKTIKLAENSYPLTIKSEKYLKKHKHVVSFTFGKVPFYGFKIRSLPYRIKPNDSIIYGLLCTSIMKNHINQFWRVFSFIFVFLGINNPVLKKIHGKKLQIYSNKEFPVQSGGEFLGYYKKISARVGRKQKFLIS